MEEGLKSPNTIQAMNEVQQAEQVLGDRVKKIQQLYHEQGDLKTSLAPKELGLAAGVGIPGLTGLSYMHENWKNE